MKATIGNSFDQLRQYCEREGFKGWDPYDGLTSKLFQSLPFIRSHRFFRLAWIQFFKRSPINFRRLALIPKQYNAKGLGLFLTGYCRLYRRSPDEELLARIHFLAEKIMALQCKGYSGSCWGYYFDWQARAFFQPAYTPTVVATSFVADALFNAYEVTGNTVYKDVALSGTGFVLNDLNRTYDKSGGFAFSYSPLDKTQVYNASLLGARLLSRAYAYTGENLLKEEACKAVKFVCDHQHDDGSWSYGTLPFHAWIDNFHTGFNLECIFEYEKYTGDTRFREYVEKGFAYYINTFFLEDGRAKYYAHKIYPIDIHAPAQLIVTLSKLGRLNGESALLAKKVLEWTVKHMQSRKGFFFYQHKPAVSSKIPYMRWAQAWMFCALACYLTETPDNS